MYIVYGIPNCDTIKKTITWLNVHHIAFQFHDYKKLGITASKLKLWSKQVGWENFLNKKSATWRKLGAEIQSKIINEKAAIKLMTENTSIIKRPVIELNNKIVLIGFDETQYKQTLK